jgi:pimeloyl-ACP methyl ester carboxylesterase
VIALAGVADLRRAWELRLSDNVTETLLGGSPEQVPDRYDTGSPYALLPLGVPQILAHGTRDANVPFEMSQRYVERAQTLGDDVQLVAMQDVGHFEPVDPATAAWRAVEAIALSLARA